MKKLILILALTLIIGTAAATSYEVYLARNGARVAKVTCTATFRATAHFRDQNLALYSPMNRTVRGIRHLDR